LLYLVLLKLIKSEYLKKLRANLFCSTKGGPGKACASRELQLDEARDQVEDPADVEAEPEAKAGPSSGGRKEVESARGRPRRGRKVQFSPLIIKKVQKYGKNMPAPVDSVVKNLVAANPFLEKTEGLAE
jgi:hypothetical protein